MVWFYGISTIVGYQMSNPVFTYILNMICKHILEIHTVKWSTVLFLMIQFSISQSWIGPKYCYI